MVKSGLKTLFSLLGYEIRRKPSPSQLPAFINSDMNGGLMRYKRLDPEVKIVIDVGAAKGKWSMLAKPHWPSASFVLFEPLAERKQQLEDLVKTNPGFYLVTAAAGKEKGSVNFVVAEDLDGSGVSSETNNLNSRRVIVTSIQDEVKRLNLQGPFLVKLDTHGFEIPILEGCQEIWDNISLFIIECYGFRIAKDSLLFWEMCEYMDNRGFRLFDMVDIMRRSKDGAFWQCDAFFIRKDHVLFRDNSYQ